MSMFDYYEPSPELVCPVCKSPLGNWQGKEGPCALLVWRQGMKGPADQRADQDSKLSSEALRKCILPRTFELYSYDCPDHIVVASGTSKDGMWTSTVIRE